MTENTAKFLQVMAALMFAAGIVLYCGMRFRPASPEVIVREVHDTVVQVRVDTLVAYKPVPFNVYTVDTLYVPVAVPGQHDTVWAALPWEEKEYRDTTYRAVVEGFRPGLKEIEVYQRTKTVTVTERVKVEPSRWSWGVQAGVGTNGTQVTPYLGVGIQYRIGYFDFTK
jgi:hypothetical protein